jgi:hypothetical protein
VVAVAVLAVFMVTQSQRLVGAYKISLHYKLGAAGQMLPLQAIHLVPLLWVVVAVAGEHQEVLVS